MTTRIVLKNGREFEYQDADIQKINQGKTLAIFDLKTFRIIAKYHIEELSICEPNNRTKDQTSAA